MRVRSIRECLQKRPLIWHSHNALPTSVGVSVGVLVGLWVGAGVGAGVGLEVGA